MRIDVKGNYTGPVDHGGCVACRGDLEGMRREYIEHCGTSPDREALREIARRHRKRVQRKAAQSPPVAAPYTFPAALPQEVYNARKRARRRPANSTLPSIEQETTVTPPTILDKDDVLRFIVAEAKKLKEENGRLQYANKIDNGRIDDLVKECDTKTATIRKLEAELEDALQAATAPKKVTVDDALAQDLAFLGYSASAK